MPDLTLFPWIILDPHAPDLGPPRIFLSNVHRSVMGLKRALCKKLKRGPPQPKGQKSGVLAVLPSLSADDKL